MAETLTGKLVVMSTTDFVTNDVMDIEGKTRDHIVVIPWRMGANHSAPYPTPIIRVRVNEKLAPSGEV